MDIGFRELVIDMDKLKLNNIHDTGMYFKLHTHTHIYIQTLDELYLSKHTHTKYNNLNSFQIVYTYFKSSETAVTHILHKFHIKDTSEYYFSVTFDTINNNILTSILISIGINDTANKWYVPYINDIQY